ncbi:unnamed protein product [Polarella glacialis]|uniref:Uncharacterized protein n=1 Tax=Polarella glacialis TaxID=89957 RepID=A0A813KMP5_POLGL|nr:unnamed protein product [Polarella glacialis]
MVTGRKQIENRGWRIPPGWYALHVGSQPLAAIGVEWCERMRVAWPEAPPERSLPSSKIVGLIHVSEQRKPGASLPKDHPQAIWAVGPICHVIDQAVELPRGIQHGGSKGLWEISEPARQRLLRQLSGLAIQSFEPLPRPEGSVIGRGPRSSPDLHTGAGSVAMPESARRTWKAEANKSDCLSPLGIFPHAEFVKLCLQEIVSSASRLTVSQS